MKESDSKDLDEAVFIWFKNARSSKIPVNAIIVKEKVLSLAKSNKNIEEDKTFEQAVLENVGTL